MKNKGDFRKNSKGGGRKKYSFGIYLKGGSGLLNKLIMGAL